jgi:predicted RNA-binding protein with PUA-like domain
MSKAYWMVKQEPTDYGWDDLVREGHTAWTGVRNAQARNNLRKMQVGDLVLFYHSGDEKRLVGIARVEREAYADPTSSDGDWSSVDIAPVQVLRRPVDLPTIRAEPALSELALVKQTRLSVMPVTSDQFDYLLKLASTPLPS